MPKSAVIEKNAALQDVQHTSPLALEHRYGPSFGCWAIISSFLLTPVSIQDVTLILPYLWGCFVNDQRMFGLPEIFLKYFSLQEQDASQYWSFRKKLWLTLGSLANANEMFHFPKSSFDLE